MGAYTATQQLLVPSDYSDELQDRRRKGKNSDELRTPVVRAKIYKNMAFHGQCGCLRVVRIGKSTQTSWCLVAAVGIGMAREIR